MASVSQLNLYQCDQCGTTNIVAAPVLYQQGTRAYSGTFSSGTSQSYSCLLYTSTVRTEVAGLDNRRCNAIPMWLVRSFASYTIRLHRIVEGICL